jgi:hypothetical protein
LPLYTHLLLTSDSVARRCRTARLLGAGADSQQCHFKNAPDCSPTAFKQHNNCLGGTWTFRRGNDYLFPCGTPEGIDSGSGSGKDKGAGPTLECGKVLNYWWEDGTPMLATCDSGYGCKAGVCDKGKGGPILYELKPEWL